MFLEDISKSIFGKVLSSVVVDLLVHTTFILIILFTVPYLCSVFLSALDRKTHSTEPPWLPSFIPFLGHSLSFMMNSEDFFTSGRKHFGSTRDIFTISLGSEVFYVLTDPRHVSAVHRNANSFSFDLFMRRTLIAFGLSAQGADRLMGTFASESSAPQTNVAQLAHAFQAEQTRGLQLQLLAQHISSFMQKRLTSDTKLTRGSSTFHTTHNGIHCISLKTFAVQNIIHGVQHGYFGPRLFEIDPKILETLIEFDELSWKAWFHYPWFMRRRLDHLADHLRSSLQTYFQIPPEERKASAWFTQKLEDEFHRIELHNGDFNALMLFFYWGINTNPSKATFWMISHILFQPELIETIRDETTPAFREDGTINTTYIAESCPRLKAIWLEVLRVYTSSTSVRYITRDTQVGRYILKKDRAIIFSAHQLHVENEAFGENTTEYDSLRFYKSPHLERSLSFRPFGGGKTLCPGRHLARHVSLSFVAILFRHYNVSLAFPQNLPRRAEGKPAIGIIGGDDDLYIQLERRVAKQ